MDYVFQMVLMLCLVGLCKAIGSDEETVLPHSQQVALAVTPKVTGLLSMICSSVIIYMVVKEKARRGRVYHRILLVMSCLDVFSSFWFFMSSWPIPVGTPNVYGAIGNTSFCTAQGFFIQLGLAVPFYNASLAVNYLCTIKHGWSDSRMKRLEPVLHAVSIGFPLVTALIALPLTLFNEANLWCWIATNPPFCTGSNCFRGENAWIYQWAFFYAELWFLMVFVAVAMFLVYRHVYKTEASAGKYQERNQFKKSKRVAMQGLLYVLAFYITWIFGTINRLYQTITSQDSFALLYLHALFVPLQGFFNFLVYIRPRYLRFREENPTKSCLQVAAWVVASVSCCRVDEGEEKFAEMRNADSEHDGSYTGWSTKRFFLWRKTDKTTNNSNEAQPSNLAQDATARDSQFQEVDISRDQQPSVQLTVT